MDKLRSNFKWNRNVSKFRLYLVAGLLIEISLLIFLSSYGFLPLVNGGVGGNVTVTTNLTVGNVYPEVLNVSIDNDAASVTLNANSTKLVVCEALVRDWNNDTDIANVTAQIFNSSWNAADDNNDHYTNSSCYINRSFVSWNGIPDTNYTALANCTFNLQYYANPGNWNCTVVVNDSVGWNATGSDNITVSELLAVGLPPAINYGTVNATYVSDEKPVNVTNFGNVAIDLDLSGYGYTQGDGLAMNCTLGSTKNISIYYEKYDINESTPGPMTLSQFESNYTNLTSSPVTEQFNLPYRVDDGDTLLVNSTNGTYWRIYVPTGVAGTCEGNIVFGAVKSV